MNNIKNNVYTAVNMYYFTGNDRSAYEENLSRENKTTRSKRIYKSGDRHRTSSKRISLVFGKYPS